MPDEGKSGKVVFEINNDDYDDDVGRGGDEFSKTFLLFIYFISSFFQVDYYFPFYYFAEFIYIGADSVLESKFPLTFFTMPVS